VVSDRAHDFDSSCNCGPCLEERGLIPDPACPRCTQLEEANRKLDDALAKLAAVARDCHPHTATSHQPALYRQLHATKKVRREVAGLIDTHSSSRGLGGATDG
jgi:hypothetical protein